MQEAWNVADFQRVLTGRVPGVQGATGHFAVLVPLVQWQGQLQLLFEFRARTLRGQPGETCFPGGRVEPGETPEQAALREAFEEIGIPPSSVEIIAPLDVVQDISGRVIYPFLGRVAPEAAERLVCNPDEVEEVFFVPWSFLQNTEPFQYEAPMVVEVDESFPYEKIGFPQKDYVWRSGKMKVLVYEYEDHQIWGLTARIVDWLLKTMEEEGP